MQSWRSRLTKAQTYALPVFTFETDLWVYELWRREKKKFYHCLPVEKVKKESIHHGFVRLLWKSTCVQKYYPFTRKSGPSWYFSCSPFLSGWGHKAYCCRATAGLTTSITDMAIRFKLDYNGLFHRKFEVVELWTRIWVVVRLGWINPRISTTRLSPNARSSRAALFLIHYRLCLYNSFSGLWTIIIHSGGLRSEYDDGVTI